MLASTFDLAPWRYAREGDAAAREAQRAVQAGLTAGGRVELGEHCFVSPLAGIDAQRIRFGANCLVAAWAVLAGELEIGTHCSFNAHAVVGGRVVFGNFVRVASHACVIGFEHVTDDVERPIFTQGIRSDGIRIGDDVWIGAGAKIVDGVSIGSHAIVGAGAVVTRDVPDYAVVVGNPARVTRDRRSARAPAPRAALRAFGACVREEIGGLLETHRVSPTHFADAPGEAPSLRALCDAIELAALTGDCPGQQPALVATLQDSQDPVSGLPLDAAQVPNAASPPLGDFQTAYQLLAVGYALECLGARLAHPVSGVAALDAAAMTAWLDALPMLEQPWNAGAWIDSLASALYFNRMHVGIDGPYAVLFDWLSLHSFPHTGLWAGGQRQHGWLQPVNGFYRIVRGSYAEFGLRVPHPRATIDTVLGHAHFFGEFAERGVVACNVLDALHALWICARATSHRRQEIRAFAARQVSLVTARWQPGRGLAFASGQAPSLHGSEMWLAALFTAAALLGEEAALGFRPRGIHRLDLDTAPARDRPA